MSVCLSLGSTQPVAKAKESEIRSDGTSSFLPFRIFVLIFTRKMNAIKSAQPHRKRNGATGRNSQRKRQRKRQEKPPAPKPACCVCSVDDTPPQYKCPRCNAQYCSVACCKKHKETCSQEKKPQEGKIENPSKYANQLPFLLTSNQSLSRRGDLEDDDDDDDDSMDEEWKMNEEMKTTLSRSQWLRNELKDGGLKDLIAQIVSAGNGKHLVLQQVKERYPIFKTFLDKLLLVAGVLERQDAGGDEEEEPFEELLERDWDEDRPTLALKSRNIRVLPVFEPIQHSSSSSESSDESDSSSEESDSSSSSEDEDSS